jgi:hypothetical protein
LITPIPGMVASCRACGAGQRGELVIISSDPLMEAFPLFTKILQQPQNPGTDRQFPSHEFVQSMPQRGTALGLDYPALKQHRAQLVGQPGPRRDQSLACPMQHL